MKAEPKYPRSVEIPCPLFNDKSPWNQKIEFVKPPSDSERQMLVTFHILREYSWEPLVSEYEGLKQCYENVDTPKSDLEDRKKRINTKRLGLGLAGDRDKTDLGGSAQFPYVAVDGYSMPIFAVRDDEDVREDGTIKMRTYHGKSWRPSYCPYWDNGIWLAQNVPRPRKTFRPAGPTDRGSDGCVIFVDDESDEEFDFWQVTTAWENGELRFSAPLGSEGMLDSRKISTGLRAEFEEKKVPLTEHASVNVIEVGAEWHIDDGEKQFTVKKENDTLDIYDRRSKGGGTPGDRILTAGGVARFDMKGLGARDRSSGTSLSCRASGLPYLGGLLLPEDLLKGPQSVIEHALAFTLPRSRHFPHRAPTDPADFVYPATRTETNFFIQNPYALAAGQRIRLKDTIKAIEMTPDGSVYRKKGKGLTDLEMDEGIPPIVCIFLRALHDYGAFLVDGSGSFGFVAEDKHTAVLDVATAESLIAEEELLFNVSLGSEGMLNNREISTDLRTEFQRNGFPLTGHASVDVIEVGAEWRIADEDSCFTVKKENDTLNIYKAEKSEEELLFNVSLGSEGMLDNREISTDLRTEFQRNDFPLTGHASVDVIEVGAEWRIADEDNCFTVKKENDTLNIYKAETPWESVVGTLNDYLCWKLSKELDDDDDDNEDVESVGLPLGYWHQDEFWSNFEVVEELEPQD